MQFMTVYLRVNGVGTDSLHSEKSIMGKWPGVSMTSHSQKERNDITDSQISRISGFPCRYHNTEKRENPPFFSFCTL